MWVLLGLPSVSRVFRSRPTLRNDDSSSQMTHRRKFTNNLLLENICAFFWKARTLKIRQFGDFYLFC